MPSPANLRDESRDYHRKAQQNVRLSDDGVAALRALSHYFGIGISSVIEMLVREKAHEKKISVSAFLKPSPRKRPNAKSSPNIRRRA